VLYVCMYACVCGCMPVCLLMSGAYICAHSHTLTLCGMYTGMYICICVYIYIYICIYILVCVVCVPVYQALAVD